MTKALAIVIGDRFGRLVVRDCISKIGERKRYLCRCDCGNDIAVLSFHLGSGATKSCGCLMAENRSKGTRFKHGHAKTGAVTPTYVTWQKMLERCHKPSVPEYRWYGARGIAVCDKWRTSFDTFLRDMGPRPAGKTIDRINNDGGYEPRNCRWATSKEQHHNRRPRHLWPSNQQAERANNGG